LTPRLRNEPTTSYRSGRDASDNKGGPIKTSYIIIGVVVALVLVGLLVWLILWAAAQPSGCHRGHP
jgi:hypothetical protein